MLIMVLILFLFLTEDQGTKRSLFNSVNINGGQTAVPSSSHHSPKADQECLCLRL